MSKWKRGRDGKVWASQATTTILYALAGAEHTDFMPYRRRAVVVQQTKVPETEKDITRGSNPEQRGRGFVDVDFSIQK